MDEATEVSYYSFPSFILVNPSLTVRRDMGRWASSNGILYRFTIEGRGLGTLGMRAYGVSDSYVASDPAGRRTCIGDSYYSAVACYDGENGGMVVTWSAPTIAITAAEASAGAQCNSSGMAGMSKSDCDAFAGKIEVPSHRPFYTGIHVDSDLNVWVLPFPRLPSDSGLVAWLVFGADGKLRARAQLPARMRQPLIFSDHALTAVSDSLGVPYVVKLPIRKS